MVKQKLIVVVQIILKKLRKHYIKNNNILLINIKYVHIIYFTFYLCIK